MPYSVPEFAKSDTIATSASLAAGATSTTLTSGNFTRTGTQHYVVDYNNAKREVISATVSGTAMTNIVRGLDGTTDQDHAANAPIISSLVPSAYQQVVDAVSGVSSADGWAAMSGTSTYASATSINIPAGGLSIHAVGDKIKFNQSIPLTSYWALDSDASDTKGANNGTNVNGTFSAGKFGNAWTGNGTDAKITITDAANLKPTGAFTVGMWVKTSQAGAVLFQSYSMNAQSSGFKIGTSSGKVLFAIGKSTGSTLGIDYSEINSSTTINDNLQHYIVCAYQGGMAKIYIDGNLDALGSSFAPVYAATNYVRIGVGNNAGTDVSYFNGQIDDLFLINGFAVDEAWVAAKYAAASAQTNANITATQYFYVTTPTDTLLTLTGGADYAVYNGAITDVYYSKASSPVGFPSNSDTFSPLGRSRVEIIGDFSVTSTSAVQVAGLSLPVVIPLGSRVRVTAYSPLIYHNGGAGQYVIVSLWDGTVGSGTKLQEFRFRPSNPDYGTGCNLSFVHSPTGGAKTYNVGIQSGAGQATLAAQDINPAYLMAEIV